jgi:hypothetical protein
VECYKLVMDNPWYWPLVLAHCIFGYEIYLKNASLHCKWLRIIVRELFSFGGFPLKQESELRFQ